MNGTIFIPSAFAILGALSLWVIIGGKGRWYAKAIIIVLTMYMGVAFWTSLKDVEGWPSGTALPKKFVLHWATIQEPRKDKADDGAIYLWVTSMAEEPRGASWIVSLVRPRCGEPRSIRLPYSRKAHEEVDGAVKGIMSGKKIAGKAPPGAGKEGPEGKEGQMTGEPGINGPDQDPMFYEMPAPKLPRKDP